MADLPKDKPSKSRAWLDRLSTLLLREPQTREQLMEVMRDAENRGVLGAEMLGMIERILQVSEMQVREVMIPKAQMIVVHKEENINDILPIVIESGHSRFPVMDSSGKDVVGMLLAKDLLKYGYKGSKGSEDFDIIELIRPAMYIPQSKRLDVLLREFRTNRNHIAIVLDEYGLVAGLVTIEDVLEQIVGEIEDEYDIDEEGGHIKQLDDGSYIVKAITPIDEFNNYFNTEFSDEEFDTIGGIILQNFGHLPKRGESTKIKNLRFKVLHSDNRRLYLIEVKKTKTRGET